MSNTLIVFARTPLIGKVKTRLESQLNKKQTLNIYNELLTNTISVSKKVKADLKLYWSEIGSNPTDKLQQGKDLGERMYNSLKAEYTNGLKVCLIGTDTPDITSKIIEDVFIALETNDIVFGPAKDGGYYLIAISVKPPKELFINKLWSHNNVLKEALSVCKKNNLTVSLAPTLLDIDTVEDLNEWKLLKSKL